MGPRSALRTSWTHVIVHHSASPTEAPLISTRRTGTGMGKGSGITSSSETVAHGEGRVERRRWVEQRRGPLEAGVERPRGQDLPGGDFEGAAVADRSRRSKSVRLAVPQLRHPPKRRGPWGTTGTQRSARAKLDMEALRQRLRKAVNLRRVFRHRRYALLDFGLRGARAGVGERDGGARAQDASGGPVPQLEEVISGSRATTAPLRQAAAAVPAAGRREPRRSDRGRHARTTRRSRGLIAFPMRWT